LAPPLGLILLVSAIIVAFKHFLMLKVSEMGMTIPQCRAARALLGWSAADLAASCKIGIATVKRFESGQTVQDASVDTMRKALEAAGVQFIAIGATSPGAGAGVRLRGR